LRGEGPERSVVVIYPYQFHLCFHKSRDLRKCVFFDDHKIAVAKLDPEDALAKICYLDIYQQC
jgi:hypothetical protein